MTRKPRHRVKATLAAGATGGGIVGLEAGALVMWNAVMAGDSSTALILGLSYSLAASMMFTPLFLIGLTLVGLPLWAVLDGMAVRSPLAAVLAGTLMSAATAAIVLAMLGVLFVSAMWFCAAFGAAGAGSGWVLHRVAYGRQPAKTP